MAKCVVHEDSHGLYVKHDGNIYRPQANRIYYPHRVSPSIKSNDTISKHNKGDKVNARRLSGCLWAYVGEEYWYYHGGYYNTKEPSENIWHRR